MTSWLYLQQFHSGLAPKPKEFLRQLRNKNMSTAFEEDGIGVALDEVPRLLQRWERAALIEAPVRTEILRMKNRGARAKLHQALLDPKIHILVNFQQSLAYGGSATGHWAFVAGWDPHREIIRLWDPDPPAGGAIDLPMDQLIQATLSRDRDNSMRIRGFVLIHD